MSHGHSDIYHKKEENISVILITFHKKGGKCQMVILTNHHKRRKIYHGREMSQIHSDHLSKGFGSLGGKTEW